MHIFSYLYFDPRYTLLFAVPVILTLSYILRCCNLFFHVWVYEPIENLHILLNVTLPTHVLHHFAILYLQFGSQYLNYCLHHCLIFLFQLYNKVLNLSHHHHHQQLQNFWVQFFFWFGHFLMIYPIEKAKIIISKFTLSWKHACKYA